MTLDKIIQGLKAVRTIHNGNYTPQIDSAIHILKHLKTELEPCDDCVSREALKERFRWLEKATKYGNEDAEQQHFSYSTMMMYEIKDEIDNVIDSLPSVQPQSLEQIKWERDTAIEQLKLLGYGLGEKFEPCEDCISREDVVRILDWSKASVQMLDDYSADELVGEIIAIEKEVENLLSVKPQTVTDFADKCKECGKILNETYQQKWIPVSERLPEEDGEYFVSIEGNITHKMIVDIAHWYKSEKANNGFYKANEVFAWMPLPQPYRESEENADASN